jgi:pimeloyl-ACP methyl ester carboxylesterase
MNSYSVKYCAALAQWAYRQPGVRTEREHAEFLEERLKEGTGVHSWRLVRVLDESTTGAQGYVAQDLQNGTMVVAFRGTETDQANDVLADIAANLAHVPWMDVIRIHRGFGAAVDSIWAPLLDAIDLQDPVVVTGHSLGGGMAQVAALRLTAESRRVHSLVTFGAPRALEVHTSQLLRLRVEHVYRVVRSTDPVPYVPWVIWRWLMGKPTYMHVGTLYYIDRRGKLWRDPDRTFVFWDWMMATSGGIRTAVANHSMDAYRSIVEGLSRW